MVEELLVVTDESEDSRSGGQIPEKSFRIFLLPIKTTAYGRATLGAKPFRRAPFAKNTWRIGHDAVANCSTFHMELPVNA
jgi:hypothetical protein